MSDFDVWFRKHAGEDSQSCKWLITFMHSDNTKEVEQIFQRYHSLLVADEMVEELNGTIEIMKGRLPHAAAFYAIEKTRDRLTLIADARSSKIGVKEAIKRHQQIAACTQKLAYLDNIQRNRALTSNQEREAGDAHYTWGLVLMSNSPADPLSPAQITSDPDRLTDASKHFTSAADDHYQYMEGTGEGGGDEYAEALFRLALIIEKFAEMANADDGFGRARHRLEQTIFHANRKKPYYQARLAEFLRRRGMSL